MFLANCDVIQFEVATTVCGFLKFIYVMTYAVSFFFLFLCKFVIILVKVIIS